MTTKTSTRSVHYRLPCSEDEKPYVPSFEEKLLYTRSQLQAETESGDMDWTLTIRHIDELLEEMKKETA
ncbi:hypothetical protein EBT16_09510 [bacterium]|nr:hypothetical protein [bacterium]